MNRSRNPFRAGGPLGGVLGFVLLLVLIRGVFLLAAMNPDEDRIANVFDCGGLTWAHGPERPLYDREELYAATAAEAIRRRLGLPLGDYRFMPYASGSLVVALIAAPLYALFGPYYLVFKLIALAVTVLGGLFWFLAVRAWTGERAARIFALLVLFAPSMFVRTALIAKGDHAEAVALAGLVLWLASRAALGRAGTGRDEGAGTRGDDQGTRLRFAVMAGLAAGLSVFISYSVLPVLLGVAAAGVLVTRARPGRLWGAAAAGFAAGLLPWIATVAGTGGAALRVYGRPLGAGSGLATAGRRVALLFNRGFLASYDLPGGMPVRTVAALVFAAAVLAGWIALLRSLARAGMDRGPDARRHLPVLVLAGTAAHLAAFSLAAPDSSSRYLMPVYPLLLLAVLLPMAGLRRVAGGYGSAQQTPGARAGGSGAGRIGVAAVVALGVVAQLWVLQGSRFAPLASPLKGTDWSLLGEIGGQKLAPESVGSLPAAVRPFFWRGLGVRIGIERPPETWPELARTAGAESLSVWEGIGLSFINSGRLDRAAAAISSAAGARREALRRGLTAYGEVFLTPAAVYQGRAGVERVLALFPSEEQPALRNSLARALGILEAQGADAAGPALGLLTPQERALAAGWGRWDGSARNAQEAARAAGFEASPAFWEGAAAAWAWNIGALSPEWILGRDGRPVRLAHALDGIARAVPPPAAAAYYTAGGRAAALAAAEPFTGRALASRALASRALAWRDVIPTGFQAQFERGLVSPTP